MSFGLIVLATNIATAGANMLIAVPLMVWSAFMFIAAYACVAERSIPEIADMSIATMNSHCPVRNGSAMP